MATAKVKKDEFVVAVLDDRDDQRETMIRGLNAALPNGWICIECPLSKDINSYPKWLAKNNVVCLLIDQLLNENAPGANPPVAYKGNDVISVIRAKLPDFPIYVVSQAVEHDPQLQANWGAADEALSRKELFSRIADYVERMMRRATGFVNRNTEQLAEFNDLAAEAATGKITEPRRERLRAIQSELGLLDSAPSERDESLTSLEAALREFAKLRPRIDAYLKTESDAKKTKKAPGRK